jgi:hypothetical protein
MERIAMSEAFQPLLSPDLFPSGRPFATQAAVVEAAESLFLKTADSDASLKKLLAEHGAVFFDNLKKTHAPDKPAEDTASELAWRFLSEESEDLEDAVNAWIGALRSALGAAVVAWVAETQPKPPTDTVCRATWRNARHDTRVGVAYRDPHHAKSGACIFVADVDYGKRPEGGVFNGGCLANYEDVVKTGPATPEDVDVYAATGNLRRKRERAAAKNRHAMDRKAETDRRLETVRDGLRKLPTQTVESMLRIAVAAVANGGAVGTDLPEYLTILAAWSVLDKRVGEAEFEAANPPE